MNDSSGLKLAIILFGLALALAATGIFFFYLSFKSNNECGRYGLCGGGDYSIEIIRFGKKATPGKSSGSPVGAKRQLIEAENDKNRKERKEKEKKEREIFEDNLAKSFFK